MKAFLKTILYTFFIIIYSVLIGFFSLYVVNLIPSKYILNNVSIAYDTDNYDVYEEELYNYKSTKIDEFIDSVILSEVIYDKGTILDRITNNYYYFNENSGPKGSLNKYIKQNIGREVGYASYWHGYIIPLKILLSCFNLSEVKVLNFCFQFSLIFAICLLLYKNKLKKYIIPFLLSLFIMMPMYFYKSFTFSLMFNLMLSSVLLFIILHKKIKYIYYKYFFLVIGILTSFFDLLTFPLITLGYLLLFYLILNNKNKSNNQIVEIFKYSFFWLLGYASMWFGKWVISDMFLDYSVIKAGINRVLYRMNVISSNVTYLDILKNNFTYVYNKINIVFLCFYILYILILNKGKINKKNIFSFWPYLLILLYPLVWYLVIKNHSYIHARFTYRILSISVFAFLIYFVNLFDKKSYK